MLIQNRSRYTLLFLIAITLSSSASGAFERPRTSSAISIDSKIIGYLEYLPAEIKTTFILVETDEIVAENTISTDCLIQRARAAHSSFRCDALYLHDVGTMYIFEHQINTASGEISSEMHTLELGAES